MYRVICTTSLVFSVAPMQRGPWHPDKRKVLMNAKWLRERGQDALVQESATGRCFDGLDKHVGTSPQAKGTERAATGGFNG